MKSNNKLPEIGERYINKEGYIAAIAIIEDIKCDGDVIHYCDDNGRLHKVSLEWFNKIFKPLPKEQEEDIQEEINLAYDIAYDKGYKDAQNTYDVAKMCVAKEDVKRLLKDYDFDWEVEGIQFRSMLEGLMMAAQNLIIELDPIKEDKTDIGKKADNLPMKEEDDGKCWSDPVEEDLFPVEEDLLECDNCLKKGEDVSYSENNGMEGNFCNFGCEPIKKTEESLPKSIMTLGVFLSSNYDLDLLFNPFSPQILIKIISRYLEYQQEQNTKDIAEMKLKMEGLDV